MAIREYVNITKVLRKEDIIRINADADAEIGMIQIPTHVGFNDYWGEDTWSISAATFLKRIKRC